LATATTTTARTHALDRRVEGLEGHLLALAVDGVGRESRLRMLILAISKARLECLKESDNLWRGVGLLLGEREREAAALLKGPPEKASQASSNLARGQFEH
jgi:hypothetical protein